MNISKYEMLHVDGVKYFTPLLENIPTELKVISQWVAWKAVPNPKPGEKPRKIPINPKTGYNANPVNPSGWGTFEQAERYFLEMKGKDHTSASKDGPQTGPVAGIGLVLSTKVPLPVGGEPLVGIDLDHCVAEDGTVESWAQEIISTVGSYTELSPSGSGIRIFVRGKKPGEKCKSGPLEMYETKRYLTMTGIPLPGAGELLPISENQAGIDAVYEKHLEVSTEANTVLPASGSAVVTPQAVTLDDDTLIAKIRASKQGFKFDALMNGDTSGYKSQSEADMALCGILVFWTQNAEQIDRIFRRSGLYRPKWDEKRGPQTYGAGIIAKLLAQRGATYQGRPQAVQGDSGVRNFLTPPPPPPVDTAFPPDIAALLKEAADAFVVPIEIIVAIFLAFLSCLVGRSRLISIKGGWLEAGNLWIGIVAKSGVGKTPAMNAFFSFISKLEREAKIAYDLACIQYRIEDKIYQKALEFYTKEQAKQANSNSAPPAPSAIPVPPTRPRLKQAFVDDTTREALGDTLEENPKGILLRADELAGMISDFDRYVDKKGGTKSRLLSLHSGGPWKTSRASKAERVISIPKAYGSIFGGIQPGMLQKTFRGGIGGADEESGFLARFLFILAVATNPALYSNQTLSYHSMKILEGIAAHLWLWDIDLDSSGNEIDMIVPVSDEARELYITWYNDIAREAHISANAAVLKKAQAHALRICLLLHCLDAALSRTDGMNLVPKDTMQRALFLVDWLLEHQSLCLALIAPGGNTTQVGPLEMAIMQAVVELADVIEKNGWEARNAELFPLVKAKLGYDRVKNEAIGKAASALGLGQRKSGERIQTISPDLMEKFRAATQLPAQPAHAVQMPETASLSGAGGVTVEPSTSALFPRLEGSPLKYLPVKFHSGTVEQLHATLPEHVINGLADVWRDACSGW